MGNPAHGATSGNADQCERDMEVARSVVEEFINKHNLDYVREVTPADDVWHPGDVAPAMDLEMHIIDHQQMQDAFPDMQMQVTNMVCNGDIVTIHFTMEGTHRGPLVDRTRGGRVIMATGKKVHWSGAVIQRFVNGKVAEGWLNYDRPAFEEQIGLMPLHRN